MSAAQSNNTGNNETAAVAASGVTVPAAAAVLPIFFAPIHLSALVQQLNPKVLHHRRHFN